MTSINRVLPKGILEKYEKGERIFNAKGEREMPFTPGEYCLAKYLDENLSEEWMIHTKPELRNRWGSFIRPTTPIRNINVLDLAVRTFYKNISGITSLRSMHKFSESPYKMFKINSDGFCQGFFDEFNGIKNYSLGEKIKWHSANFSVYP